MRIDRRSTVLKSVAIYVAMIVMTLAFSACNGSGEGGHISAPPLPPFQAKIMPLGDSITYDDANYYIEHPVSPAYRVAYRQALWYMLEDANYSADLDFVGSQRAGFAVQPPIDPDNEGHPGWTSYQIAAHIYNWLVMNPANIILLHIGTNDGLDSADGVRQVLDEIDRYEEDHSEEVHVFVALIIDRRQPNSTTARFNHNLKILIDERIADGDNLTLVDMYHGAGLNSGDYLEYTHPNQSGYRKMAKVWFDALMQYKKDLQEAGEIAPD